MVKLMRGNKKASKNWEEAAYSYFKNGMTVRTPQYRYTKYFREEMPEVELYDHALDPYENNNVAKKHPKLIKKMDIILENMNTGIYENKH